jgi:hypothetical protein
MNRKQLIEKIILKELKDIELMKKVRQLNEYKTLKGLKQQAKKEGIKYNPNEVKTRQALKNIINAPIGGDSSLENDENDPSMSPSNAQDKIEDQQARAEWNPEQESEDRIRATTERVTAKNKNLESVVSELGQHIPAFAKLASTKGKTPRIHEADPEHLEQIMQSAHESHPHLRPHLTKLRTLLGM